MKKLITIIGIILLATGCKKEDKAEQNSTANTATSNDYFKCKIQGMNWTATDPTGKDTIIGSATCYLIKNKVTAMNNQLAISVLPFNQTSWALESALYINNVYDIYDDNFTMTNLQLTITKDSVNRILTGTFSFPLVNVSSSTDTVKITEGEFKVKY
jgi:hypothetical protein